MKSLLIGINSKYIHPSMGLHQIACNSKTKVVIREFTIKDDPQEIINFILESSFDLLGFSLYIWNIEVFKKIIPVIREKVSKPIFLGGPEVSYNAPSLFSYGIDYIIKNEGEESFNELTEYLEHKREITEVSNLYYKDETIKYTFDKAPDLSHIKHDYSLIGDFEHKIVYVEASRGCFFHCSYCMASLDNNVRFFDLQMIKDELKFLLEKKTKTIKFLDRSFNVRKDVMMEIFTFIKENDNLITTFQFEVVGDILTTPVIDLLNSMRKGYIRLEIGIQSTNEKTLAAVCRKQNFEKLKENISLLRDNVIIHSDLIAGLPYEDYNSFINTFNSSFLCFSHELQLGFLKELKGTPISITKELYGYKFSQASPFEVISNNYITEKELDEIRLCEEGLDKFYNKNSFPKCNDYLFKKIKVNPFFFYHDLMLYIKNNYDKDISKMQKDELYKIFYLFSSKYDLDKDYLFFLLKMDYLTSFLIKPKIWWDSNIDRREKRECFMRLVSKEKSITIDDLYKSSKLEKYNENYFLVLYKENKNYLFTFTNKK